MAWSSPTPSPPSGRSATSLRSCSRTSLLRDARPVGHSRLLGGPPGAVPRERRHGPLGRRLARVAGGRHGHGGGLRGRLVEIEQPRSPDPRRALERATGGTAPPPPTGSGDPPKTAPDAGRPAA